MCRGRGQCVGSECRVAGSERCMACLAVCVSLFPLLPPLFYPELISVLCRSKKSRAVQANRRMPLFKFPHHVTPVAPHAYGPQGSPMLRLRWSLSV